MSQVNPFASRLGLRRLLALGLAIGGLLLGAAVAPAQEPDRSKDVEQLRKQIDELNAKLKALEASSGAAKPKEAKPGTPLPEAWLKGVNWRSIGPANMGGRIVALSVFEADPTVFWVATASGGLLKTENNGVTFEHQFDREATVSIGDVCVAPSDKNIVWVGTGENNPRNSVSYGDGVYKSTDGGKTWANMGLKGTFQIGRVLVHPKDPNIVYVGALGRLYGPNEERGLFKTVDGGKTWEKVLFVDDRTGIIEMQMHPTEPDTLLVATYQRKRDIYDTNDPEVKWGPGAGLHRTTDGGKTWTKLTKGLPTGQLGRIGLSYYRKNPKIVYALVESEAIGTGPPQAANTGGGYLGLVGEDEEDKAQIVEVVAGGPADKAGLKKGDQLNEIDGKAVKKYSDFIDSARAKKPGEKAKVKVTREGKPVEIEVTLGERPAGRTAADPKKPFLDSLGGQRENIQERQGPDGFQYGGVYRSEDGGDSWARVNSLNPRPMYFSQIRVDPSDDQIVYVLGVSMYRSADGGKKFTPDAGRNVHADQHALWIDPRDGRHLLLGCDGGVYVSFDRTGTWDHLNHSAIAQFYDVAIDHRQFYNAYGGLQDNGTWGGPTRTRTGTGPINEDWLNIGGGDGFGVQVDPNDADLIYYTSQNGAVGRRNLKTGEVASFRPRPPERDKPLRWNWSTPFILSSHNSKIYYVAGNYVFRSLDRGNELAAISKDITRTDKGSATALAESPKDPNVLYVGTDDGNLWVTRDGGREWTQIDGNVGLPRPMCVSTIEPSRAVAGRVYVCFDGHRTDDDGAYIYVSEDYGKTFKSLGASLPRGSTRCLREDITNPEVLYLGTEFAVWASIDRGQAWTRINGNLPTVAIHELVQHPTLGEMVAATHGRSLWIVDIEPIRQASAEVLKGKAHLFKPIVYQRFHRDPTRGQTNRRYVGTNPPNGLPLYYHLGAKAEKLTLKIFDVEGQAIRTLSPTNEPGLQRVVWDLSRISTRPARREAPRPAAGEGGETPASETPGGEGGESAAGGEGRERGRPQGGGGGPGGGGRPQAVAAGTYRVVLTVDGVDFSQVIVIEPDPDAPRTGLIAEQPEEEEDEEERERAEVGRRIDD